MRTCRSLIVLVGMALTFVPTPERRADETRPDDPLRKVKELLEQSANWYDLLPRAEATVRLRPEFVLRWQNPLRGGTGAGVLAVWTDRGRPAAMASIFQWHDGVCHEFASLSRSNTLVARDQTGVIWTPNRPGVDFRDVPDAPAPAANPAARLRQMKALSERFTTRLSDVNGEANRQVLRLLPKPIYRYDLKEAPTTDPLLRDGAMFVFAMGTDPEVVLLLEAVERDKKTVWQYAFARATAWAVEAKLGDTVVWSVGPLMVSRDPTSTIVQIIRPLP
jgi:hypothetical protein